MSLGLKEITILYNKITKVETKMEILVLWRLQRSRPFLVVINEEILFFGSLFSKYKLIY